MSRQSVIFALDVSQNEHATRLIHALEAHVGCFKIGLELFIAEGAAFVRFATARAPVFLDLKLHDIPATVGRAAGAAAKLGVTYLTVHAQQQAALRAAVAAAPEVGILAVTVLTSVAQASTEEIVGLARSGKEAGLDGVVASPLEIEALRSSVGKEFLVVTPGIRPKGSAAGDQKRIATPGEAVRKGADYIVVGRPIIESPDPQKTVRAILADINS